MSVKATRSLLLEQGKDHVDICGVNCKYVAKEIIDFMKDDYIRKVNESYELYDDPKPVKCELLDLLVHTKDAILEIEEELGIKLIEKK